MIQWTMKCFVGHDEGHKSLQVVSNLDPSDRSGDDVCERKERFAMDCKNMTASQILIEYGL